MRREPILSSGPWARPRLRLALAVAALGAVVAAPLAGHASGRTAAPSGWHARPATYGVVAQKNVPIRMSDGATLMADVYRPATKSGAPAKGRFPVLLSQTPYNKATGATLAF